MKCHYLDLGSASDWLKIFFSQPKALPRPGCSDTPSEYGILAVFPQATFQVETNGGTIKCWCLLKRAWKKNTCLKGQMT